jgi:hypothetical protein
MRYHPEFDGDEEDGEHKEEIDNFFKEIEGNQDQITAIEARLNNLNLNQQLLENAIFIATKGVLWRFYSLNRKLNLILTIYKAFSDIVRS